MRIRQILEQAALWLDAIVTRLVKAGRWLALPVIALLFLQWPLRDLARCCSREANDLGQWLFALFIAVALTAATREGVHLAADSFAKGRSPRFQILVARLGAAFIIMPWAGLVIAISWPAVLDSTLRLERFADTSNSGYFIIKLAMLLMAALMIAQALADLLRGKGGNP
jgi:TRAP-type mannitol/chloroaromatic compound transport system permease small subunit